MPICEMDLDEKSKWARKWAVPSTSNPSKHYTVSILKETGEWQCSCPAWKFKRKQCSHIKSAMKISGEPKQNEEVDIKLKKVTTELLIHTPKVEDWLKVQKILFNHGYVWAGSKSSSINYSHSIFKEETCIHLNNTAHGKVSKILHYCNNNYGNSNGITIMSIKNFLKRYAIVEQQKEPPRKLIII